MVARPTGWNNPGIKSGAFGFRLVLGLENLSTIINEYLNNVKTNLRLEPPAEKEVMTELANHIEDEVSDLKKKGLHDDEAENTCIKLLGSAKTVAMMIYEAHSQGTWKQALMASLPHILFGIIFILNWWRGITPVAGHLDCNTFHSSLRLVAWAFQLAVSLVGLFFSSGAGGRSFSFVFTGRFILGCDPGVHSFSIVADTKSSGSNHQKRLVVFVTDVVAPSSNTGLVRSYRSPQYYGS